MQQITNGQRPATKQRDTDIIISRQTQTNIRNLNISKPYTKATQKNKQNKDKYGQSIQHNKKRMQSKEKIKTKHKQTHKSPTTIKLSRELQNNIQYWNITPQPSVVCWTSWPAQPGQDGREFRQPGGAQKRVTHPGEAEDS